jgi:hypothetical protein
MPNKEIEIQGVMIKKDMKGSGDETFGVFTIEYLIRGNFTREGEISEFYQQPITITLEDRQLDLYNDAKRKNNEEPTLWPPGSDPTESPSANENAAAPKTEEMSDEEYDRAVAEELKKKPTASVNAGEPVEEGKGKKDNLRAVPKIKRKK